MPLLRPLFLRESAFRLHLSSPMGTRGISIHARRLTAVIAVGILETSAYGFDVGRDGMAPLPPGVVAESDFTEFNELFGKELTAASSRKRFNELNEGQRLLLSELVRLVRSGGDKEITALNDARIVEEIRQRIREATGELPPKPITAKVLLSSMSGSSPLQLDEDLGLKLLGSLRLESTRRENGGDTLRPHKQIAKEYTSLLEALPKNRRASTFVELPSALEKAIQTRRPSNSSKTNPATAAELASFLNDSASDLVLPKLDNAEVARSIGALRRDVGRSSGFLDPVALRDAYESVKSNLKKKGGQVPEFSQAQLPPSVGGGTCGGRAQAGSTPGPVLRFVQPEQNAGRSSFSLVKRQEDLLDCALRKAGDPTSPAKIVDVNGRSSLCGGAFLGTPGKTVAVPGKKGRCRVFWASADHCRGDGFAHLSIEKAPGFEIVAQFSALGSDAAGVVGEVSCEVAASLTVLPLAEPSVAGAFQVGVLGLNSDRHGFDSSRAIGVVTSPSDNGTVDYRTDLTRTQGAPVNGTGVLQGDSGSPYLIAEKDSVEGCKLTYGGAISTGNFAVVNEQPVGTAKSGSVASGSALAFYDRILRKLPTIQPASVQVLADVSAKPKSKALHDF